MTKAKRPQRTPVNATHTYGANMSRKLRPLVALTLVALISAGCGSTAPSKTGAALTGLRRVDLRHRLSSLTAGHCCILGSRLGSANIRGQRRWIALVRSS